MKDPGGYDALIGECLDDYKPQGHVEEYLVQEIVDVVWRKQRLRLAEKNIYTHLQPDEERSAYRILDSLHKGYAGYLDALDKLPPRIRRLWEAQLSRATGNPPLYAPDNSGLAKFLALEVLPSLGVRSPTPEGSVSITPGPPIFEAERLEPLARYVHLDRKFERTVAMLLKVQQLRRVESTVDQGSIQP